MKQQYVIMNFSQILMLIGFYHINTGMHFNYFTINTLPTEKEKDFYTATKKNLCSVKQKCQVCGYITFQIHLR